VYKQIGLNQTLLIGAGAITHIIDMIEMRRYYKALIVTDKVIAETGILDVLIKLLDANSKRYEIYDDVTPDPTVEGVIEGVKRFEYSNADYLIALGGGSVLDTAKAIGLVVANPEFGDVVSLKGVTATKNRSMPVIAVTTTAGTGSEATSIVVLKVDENSPKIVCYDRNCIPEIAVVDYDITAGMPRTLALNTGFDALVHAIEGYLSKDACPITDMYNLRAITLIGRNLEKAVNDDIREAKDNVSLGQYLAAQGFTNCGLGIAHAMGHQLGSTYHMPHGKACGMLITYVMEFNAEYTGDKYRDIARELGVPGTEMMSEAQYRMAAIEAVKDLQRRLGFPTVLSEEGVKAYDLEEMSKKALVDFTAQFNPRPISKKEILEVFKKAY